MCETRVLRFGTAGISSRFTFLILPMRSVYRSAAPTRVAGHFSFAANRSVLSMSQAPIVSSSEIPPIFILRAFALEICSDTACNIACKSAACRAFHDPLETSSRHSLSLLTSEIRLGCQGRSPCFTSDNRRLSAAWRRDLIYLKFARWKACMNSNKAL